MAPWVRFQSGRREPQRATPSIPCPTRAEIRAPSLRPPCSPPPSSWCLRTARAGCSSSATSPRSGAIRRSVDSAPCSRKRRRHRRAQLPCGEPRHPPGRHRGPFPRGAQDAAATGLVSALQYPFPAAGIREHAAPGRPPAADGGGRLDHGASRSADQALPAGNALLQSDRRRRRCTRMRARYTLSSNSPRYTRAWAPRCRIPARRRKQ